MAKILYFTCTFFYKELEPEKGSKNKEPIKELWGSNSLKNKELQP